MRSTLSMLHSLRSLDDDRLGAPHRLVLAMLLAHRHGDDEKTKADRRGASDPSVRQLMSSTRLGESTVHRVLAQLRAWGYVTTRIEGHHHAATVYDIILPDHQGSQRETSQRETSQSESQGSRSESQGSRSESGGVQERDLLRIRSADHSADHSEDHLTSPSAPVPADAVTAVAPLKLSIDEEAESEKPTKGKKNGKTGTSADVQRVFDAYLSRRRRNGGGGADPQLTPKRRSLIQKRLAEGYTVERFVTAFAGLFGSAFHCGANDAGTKYLDMDRVIGAGEAVEKFEAMANGTTTPVRRTGNGPTRQAPVDDAHATWRRAGA
jgi:hypothetical protein